jgi:hypothetical protein
VNRFSLVGLLIGEAFLIQDGKRLMPNPAEAGEKDDNQKIRFRHTPTACLVFADRVRANRCFETKARSPDHG